LGVVAPGGKYGHWADQTLGARRRLFQQTSGRAQAAEHCARSAGRATTAFTRFRGARRQHIIFDVAIARMTMRPLDEPGLTPTWMQPGGG